MSASARLAAAFAVAASLFGSALPAASADLYEPPSAGAAYDDPPYGDVYGDEGPGYDRYARSREAFEPPYRPSLKDDDTDVAPHARRRGAWRYGARCVSRDVARDRLLAEGWGDFHDLELRDDVVLVRARRQSGRLFDLTIDRCSGRIVDARRVRSRRSVAYGRRRHWPRPY